MTTRWTPGKKPTKADIRAAITNAVSTFLRPEDVEKITEAIHRLITNRIEGKS